MTSVDPLAASEYAVRHPTAFVRLTVFCPWASCSVARIQDTPFGGVLTVILRGAPTAPLPIPENSPKSDASRLPLGLMRLIDAPRGKRDRNFCYLWEEPMPAVTWTMVCRHGAGTVTTEMLQFELSRTRKGGLAGCKFVPHPAPEAD